MRTRDTLAGLVVLALVVAGVFWARGYRFAGGERPALQRSSDAQRSSEPRGFSPGGPAAGTANADAALPDITAEDASVDQGDLRVTLSVAPRPPVAFTKRFYRVRVLSNGAPAALDEGRISFEMKMPMGEHRYALVAGADGWDEAVVLLPYCTSGDPRWYATVEGTVGGRPVVAGFRVDVTKPGSAPAP